MCPAVENIANGARAAHVHQHAARQTAGTAAEPFYAKPKRQADILIAYQYRLGLLRFAGVLEASHRSLIRRRRGIANGLRKSVDNQSASCCNQPPLPWRVPGAQPFLSRSSALRVAQASPAAVAPSALISAMLIHCRWCRTPQPCQRVRWRAEQGPAGGVQRAATGCYSAPG